MSTEPTPNTSIEPAPAPKKKKTFSTMEIVLVGVLLGSLALSFLQARQDEDRRR
jgi:hypothetical protein